MGNTELHEDIFDVYADSYKEELDKLLSSYGTNYRVFAQKRGQILKDLYVRDFDEDNVPSILDFGCGVGGLVPVLKDFFKGCRYTGYEPSKESIKLAKKYFEGERCQFFCDRGLIGKDFAIIIVSGVLHHVLDRRERLDILHFLLSCLGKRGRLVIFEHNPYNPLTQKIVKDCVFDEDVRLINRSELTKLVLESGGSILDKGYYSFFPFHNKISLLVERALNWFPLGAQHYLSCTNLHSDSKT